MLWIQYIICAGLILIFGSRLTKYADNITKKGIFTASFMGVFFLAFITSCPEIATSLGSITIVHAPDLAAGDLIGAVIINLCVIAMLSVLHKKGPILTGGNKANLLSAFLTVLMLGLIIGFISLRQAVGLKLGIFNIGIDSILLGLIYVIGMRAIYKHEAGVSESKAKERLELSVWIKFSGCALVIIVSGFWLARTGKAIADFYGWNEMIIGLTLMAVTTTMPEFVVSLSALRLGSVEMSVGNLLGSNFFNLTILAILDIFFRRGEFLSHVSVYNIYPAFIAMFLLLITIFRMTRKRC